MAYLPAGFGVAGLALGDVVFSERVIDRVSLSLILLFMQVQLLQHPTSSAAAPLLSRSPCVKADFMRFCSSDFAAGDG